MAGLLALLTALAYRLSSGGPRGDFDYTFRVAAALLEGRLGLDEAPGWLNELVPLHGRYYSVFPLGAVLSQLPLAVLRRLGLLTSFPGAALAAALAAATTALAFALAGRHGDQPSRRVLYALFPALGSWMWANLAFAGAWQIALGFAVVGQLLALLFSLRWFRPALAGLGFALAFGNRTELLLLTPLFGFLVWRGAPAGRRRQALAVFAAAPLVLGLLTLAYNQARFGSPLDFGYARIPGVLAEPWYRDGLFAWSAVPRNAYHMLLEPWRRLPAYPWLVPSGWGGSILLSCPLLLLLLLLRAGARDRALAAGAWTSIAAVTLVLWLHGNPGGWQCSYRYAIELLPLVLVLLTESGGPRPTRVEWTLFALSVGINAWSAYLFCWTTYL